MSTRTALFVAAAAVGVLVIALARGEEPSGQQRALRDDPMATYVPQVGTLVDTDSQNEGSALGKPMFARFSRIFKLPAGSSERALRDAREAAVAAGWSEVGSNDRVFSADKQLPTGGARLGITLLEDPRLLRDDVEPPALLVSLRHLGP
ncbi:MAG: hypothetical protein ABIR67_02135 [Gaiellaceae bacterium]